MFTIRSFDMCIHFGRILTIELITYLYITFCYYYFLFVRMLVVYSLNQFQLYKTVLLIVATMRSIRLAHFIHLITKSFNNFLVTSISPTPQPHSSHHSTFCHVFFRNLKVTHYEVESLYVSLKSYGLLWLPQPLDPGGDDI